MAAAERAASTPATTQREHAALQPAMTTSEDTRLGMSVKLSVPLDAANTRTRIEGDVRGPTLTSTVSGVSRSMRRDSLERRDALLKGKQGSRQRRRWENDRLLSNPWAEPPLPSDWEVCPTYPTRTVPYYLAPLWDAAEFQRSVEAKLNARANGRSSNGGKRKRPSQMSKEEQAASNVPKEIRAKLRHTRSAKGLLHDLEEVVRGFVVKWNEKERRLREEGLQDVLIDDSDSESDYDKASQDEEEEIVFVGRNGVMLDSPGRKQREFEEGLEKYKLVFEGLVEDKGASFGRWLVHEIGAYYGLATWSVTVEGPPRKREAYVSVVSRDKGERERSASMGRLRNVELPRPLWGMV